MAQVVAQNTPVQRTEDGVVVVDWETILKGEDDPSVDLSASIKEAFGNHDDALGIILVRFPEVDLQDLAKDAEDEEDESDEKKVRDTTATLAALRSGLLLQASALAILPAEALEKLKVPSAQYQFGWSHGNEVINGKPDTEKGSFYAYPFENDPAEGVDEETRKRYPMYYHGNVWPGEELNLKEDFTGLGSMIAGIGFMLARHCDIYAQAALPNYPPEFLSTALAQSNTVKGRLLHYFPKKPTDPATQTPTAEEDPASWCGWHLDHSLLTGLVAAMYIDETTDFHKIDTPDPAAGLYIKPHSGKITQVHIPENCIAFQAGEALQVATDGQLRGTWHCVRAPRVNLEKPGARVARNSFAVFLQPRPETVLGSSNEKFGDFTRRVLDEHY